MEKGDGAQHVLSTAVIAGQVEDPGDCDGVQVSDDNEDESSKNQDAAAISASGDAGHAHEMTALQTDGVYERNRDFQGGAAQQQKEDAVGGDLYNSPVVAGASASSPARRFSCDSALDKILPSSAILPARVPMMEDFGEASVRDVFIKNVTKYEGAARPPNEEFEIQWATREYDLREIMEGGLIPQDSVASSGLNENSYQDFKLCAEELQSNLFEEKLFESLSNLRGFRRLFSKSRDPILRHAFRGDPMEVLQNIYYGGDGILPEDRMIRADPFGQEMGDKLELDGFTFDD